MLTQLTNRRHFSQKAGRCKKKKERINYSVFYSLKLPIVNLSDSKVTFSVCAKTTCQTLCVKYYFVSLKNAALGRRKGAVDKEYTMRFNTARRTIQVKNSFKSLFAMHSSIHASTLCLLLRTHWQKSDYSIIIQYLPFLRIFSVQFLKCHGVHKIQIHSRSQTQSPVPVLAFLVCLLSPHSLVYLQSTVLLLLRDNFGNFTLIVSGTV